MMPDRRRITRAWLVLALLALPAVTFATGSAAPDTAGWPTSRANFQRTGKSLLPGPRSQPAVAWHVARSADGGNADGVLPPAGGTPIVGADGSVYVHNVDGVSVFTPTGSLRWAYALDRGDTVTVAPSGAVYAPSCRSDAPNIASSALIALTKDGKRAWRLRLRPRTGCFAPAVAGDGTLVTTGGGHTYGISPTGKILWHTDVAGWTAPALGAGGTIYTIGGADRTLLVALDPAGKTLWEADQGAPVHAPPVVGRDGTLYLTVGHHHLRAVRPDGTTKWSRRAALGAMVAIGKSQKIIGVTRGGVVIAYDPWGGVRWRKRVPGAEGPVSIDSRGTIFVPSSGPDRIVALEPAAGHVLWRWRPAKAIDPQAGAPDEIAIGPDHMLFFTDDGQLWAIGPDSAAPVVERFAFRSGETTRFRKTAIRITASDNDGVTDMQLSEDPTFRRAIWQTFDGSTQFLLSAGAGEKTLFVRVRDRSGNVSAAASASITLVRRPPP